jgi:hypothetical protein
MIQNARWAATLATLEPSVTADPTYGNSVKFSITRPVAPANSIDSKHADTLARGRLSRELPGYNSAIPTL